MLKSILIGISIAVLLDFAAFQGAYTHKVVGAGVDLVVTVVTMDWKLTHT